MKVISTVPQKKQLANDNACIRSVDWLEFEFIVSISCADLSHVPNYQAKQYIIKLCYQYIVSLRVAVGIEESSACHPDKIQLCKL